MTTAKPETTNALVKLVQQKYSLPAEEIMNILLQLESENKIRFAKKTRIMRPTSFSLNAYLISTETIWFWLTMALVIAAATAVFIIPADTYPLVYIRQTLGVLFVLFLPGFAFIKMLYPSKVPMTTSSENLDAVERIAFSFGLSIALTAMTGLILNYTPWGIRLNPITFSLMALTTVLATVAVLREYKEKPDVPSY